MNVDLPKDRPDRLMSPKEAIDYLDACYGIKISIASLYSMMSRGEAPKATYFRNRPKFYKSDLLDWVNKNKSDNRK